MPRRNSRSSAVSHKINIFNVLLAYALAESPVHDGLWLILDVNCKAKLRRTNKNQQLRQLHDRNKWWGQAPLKEKATSGGIYFLISVRNMLSQMHK